MFVRYVGLSATLALAANAVLLPPGVALSQEHAEEHEKAMNPYRDGAIVPLRCYGCPFAKVEGEGMIWTSDEVENSLVYDFGLGEHQDRLTLGGVQLYPPSFNEPEPIYVAQVPADVESTEEYLAANPERKALRVTGMEFSFNGAETVSENGNELLSMHLRIFGLADMPVPPQVLRIFVIKDAQGRLSLAHITKLNNQLDIHADEMEQCKNWPLLCKWRSIMADKIAALTSGKPKRPGCNKSRPSGHHVDTRPHHVRPWGKTHPEGRPHGSTRPHHGAHGHGWSNHHHSKLHRFAHTVARVLVNIVVPILIGVAAGVATYTAGMLIGMTAALIWVKLRASRRGQYDTVPQDDEGSDDYKPSDKKAYLDEEAPEQIGEAPPVYQEVVEKEVVN